MELLAGGALVLFIGVATYGYVNPVIAVILGWLVLREPLTLRTIVATVIVVGAVMLIIGDSQKQQR